MTASRILVVDDEADIRGLLKEILSEEGYDVDMAADATQARSSRATQVPDLVLLDIWMPDTDGITLLREWSMTDGYDCPVVMMSGHGTVETAVEATRLGAFDFVEKPLSLTKLLRTVERALDAGRRKRLSARSAEAGARRTDRQSQGHADAARAGAAGRLELLPGAVAGRIGLRARSLRALSALTLGTRVEAVFHGGRGEPGKRPAAALFGSERDGRVEPGVLDQAAGGSLFIQRARGFEQRRAARAARRDRTKRLHSRRRPAAFAAQCALDQFGAGRLRVARLARTVSPRPRWRT